MRPGAAPVARGLPGSPRWACSRGYVGDSLRPRASVVLGAGAIARFGTPDQQRQWAAPAGRGELILAAALSEEDGDDPRVPAVSAERVAGHWVLTGVKT